MRATTAKLTDNTFAIVTLLTGMLPARILAADAPADAQAQAPAQDTLTTVLQLAELPVLFVAICTCLYAWHALRVRDINLPSAVLSRAMLLLAVGYLIMGIGHLSMQYTRLTGDNLFQSLFGADIGTWLWLSALILTWFFLAAGLVLIVRFITRRQVSESTRQLKKRLRHLENKSHTDPLTGIWNRRYLDKAGKALIGALKRQGDNCCVCMLDLDNFRQVNDRFGHQGGDQALRTFCTTVRRCIRSSDIFARTGGEEFVLLLPSESREAVESIIQRILADVAAEEIITADHSFRITTSVGIAYCDNISHSLEHLLSVADQALYQSKNNGRNCMTLACV